MATVRIPTPLRSFTRGQAQVSIPGSTVGEVLGHLERGHPGISARLLDDAGKVRRYVNIFLNEEDIRFLQGLETPVKDGDQLTLVPAVAGG